MNVVRDKTGWPLPPEKTGIGTGRGGHLNFWDHVLEIDADRRRRIGASASISSTISRQRSARMDKVEGARK